MVTIKPIAKSDIYVSKTQQHLNCQSMTKQKPTDTRSYFFRQHKQNYLDVKHYFKGESTRKKSHHFDYTIKSACLFLICH